MLCSGPPSSIHSVSLPLPMLTPAELRPLFLGSSAPEQPWLESEALEAGVDHRLPGLTGSSRGRHVSGHWIQLGRPPHQPGSGSRSPAAIKRGPHPS